MTEKQAPPGSEREAEASAGPLFAAAAAGDAEGGPAQGGAPQHGDAEDAAARGEAPDDPGRLNRNMEQMLESMDGLLDVLLKTQARLGPGGKEADGGEAAPDADGAPVHAADFYRWIETDRRRRRRWSGLALAAAAPAALLLGLLIQQQFQVIPVHDPSGGWGGWIWETHGRAIVDCALEARQTQAEVDCPLVVRRP